MAIRERLGRMLRNSSDSDSSSNSSGMVSAAPSSSNSSTDATSAPLSKPLSRLARLTSWRSSSKLNTFTQQNNAQYPTAASPTTASPRPKPVTRQTASAVPTTKRPPLHPSERPLTESNLRHLEVLNKFQMTFGRTEIGGPWRRSCDGMSGISPGNSRAGSLEISRSESVAPCSRE